MGIVFTGFPQCNIHFHDSGVGGDTIPKAIVRFDWDVALQRPTVVSIELGMNDSGAGPESVFKLYKLYGKSFKKHKRNRDYPY